MKRDATQKMRPAGSAFSANSGWEDTIFFHAENAELWEAQGDAKFVSGRFCDFSEFCVRKKIISPRNEHPNRP